MNNPHFTDEKAGDPEARCEFVIFKKPLTGTLGAAYIWQN